MRIISNSYLFEGKHYLPGPGGDGVVDENNQPVNLPDNFPGHLRHDLEGSPEVPGHLKGSPEGVNSGKSAFDKEVDVTTLDSKTVDELGQIASAYGLTVQGSGSNGKVLKADLISAITVAANKE